MLATMVGRQRKFQVINSGSNGFEIFVLIFSGIFLKILVRQNNLWETFSFHKAFLS